MTRRPNPLIPRRERAPQRQPATQPRWAFVHSISPLRVRVEHEEDPLEATPTSLVPGLVVGDRVRLDWDRRSVIIVGKVHPY